MQVLWVFPVSDTSAVWEFFKLQMKMANSIRLEEESTGLHFVDFIIGSGKSDWDFGLIYRLLTRHLIEQVVYLEGNYEIQTFWSRANMQNHSPTDFRGSWSRLCRECLSSSSASCFFFVLVFFVRDQRLHYLSWSELQSFLMQQEIVRQGSLGDKLDSFSVCCAVRCSPHVKVKSRGWTQESDDVRSFHAMGLDDSLYSGWYRIFTSSGR